MSSGTRRNRIWFGIVVYFFGFGERVRSNRIPIQERAADVRRRPLPCGNSNEPDVNEELKVSAGKLDEKLRLLAERSTGAAA
jgi:hypothetical protein